MHRRHKTNYLVSVSGKGRIHLDSYMWTLDKPTASLSASIGAVAWVAILLRILLNGYVRQTINDLAARTNKKERIVIRLHSQTQQHLQCFVEDTLKELCISPKAE